MPSIDVVMERSLRRGFLDLVASSMQPLLEGRDVITDAQGKITDVKTAFSSWDNCMKADFCKWPVIAIIVIGGLMILSIVWCIARCCCCGLSCCCECCYCLKCCGECCGMCSAPRGKRHKYLDEPYIPPHHAGGYKSEPPMFNGPARVPSPTIMPARAVGGGASVPQYAEFDVSKKRASGGAHEDALPQMPSWEGAGSKKVMLEEEEAVELEQLKKPEASTAGGLGVHSNEQITPLMTGTSATRGPASPLHGPGERSPFGATTPSGPGGSTTYLGSEPDGSDPYGLGNEPYSPEGAPYGHSNSSLGTNAAYAVGGAAAGAAMGRGGRPLNNYNNNDPYRNNAGMGPEQGFNDGRPQPRGYGPPPRQGSFDQYGRSRGPQPARQGSFDDFGRQDSGGPRPGGFDNYGPQQNPNQGYATGPGRLPAPRGPGQDMPSGPGYPQDRTRRSPGPQGNPGYPANNYNSNRGYNRPGGPQRDFSSESTRPLARNPEPYADDAAPPSPNLQNNSGFDFNSGYSRPGTADGQRRRPSAPQQQPQPPMPQPQQQQPGGGAYPGYKAYQPPQQGGW